MHGNEKIFSVPYQKLAGLVFDRKISKQMEYLFAIFPSSNFVFSPFLRGNGEIKDFYDNYSFLGFCPRNFSRDAYRW